MTCVTCRRRAVRRREIIVAVPAVDPKKGSVRSGMPSEDEEPVGASGIFWTRRGRTERSVHSLPANDNYNSLCECNYSRAARFVSINCSFPSSNCRMIRTDVFPAHLTAAIKKEMKETLLFNSILTVCRWHLASSLKDIIMGAVMRADLKASKRYIN